MHKSGSRYTALFTAIAAITASQLSSVVQAQQLTLQEIVVTAQKR